jgi:hypothetical protein
MMRRCKTVFPEEVKKALREELGDTAEKRLPKDIKPDAIKNYIKERYKNSPDGVLFREGSRHTHASVDNGANWVPLGGRHPSQTIDDHTAKSTIQQLDDSRLALMQARQQETKSLHPKQWAEEVRSLNLLKNPKIYEAPNEDGSYTGSILYKDPSERYCVQKLSERAIVLHDARKFPDGLPEKGNVVRINYQSGIAEIAVIKTRTYERDGR